MDEAGLTYQTRLVERIAKKTVVAPSSSASLITLKWINPTSVLGNSLIPTLFEDLKFP